jgi:prephenate dehydratase
MEKVAVLGPAGTFTGVAAGRMYPKAKLVYLDDIEQVFRFAQDKEGVGVVAIENSLEGSVGRNLELLMKYDLKITAEATLDIRLALMARKGLKPKDIKVVMSHSHALAQCREYLLKNLPKARQEAVSSTSEAMKEAAKSADSAAIGSKDAGLSYGLEALADGIEDMKSQTRFISISKDGSDGPKTSLIFAVSDEPGALYSILKVFSDSLINLTKIESRPSRRKLGEYVFFLDYENKRMKPQERETLHARILERTTYFKDLGSYGQTAAE